MTEARPDVYGIYMNGLDEDSNFYAREAEESGLHAVYNAGFAAGREAKPFDFGPVLGDGDVVHLNGEEYKVRFIEEDMIGGYNREGIRLVLVKEEKE